MLKSYEEVPALPGKIFACVDDVSVIFHNVLSNNEGLQLTAAIAVTSGTDDTPDGHKKVITTDHTCKKYSE